MAGAIQDAPNTVPGGVSDWEDELNLRELSMRGYDGVSLTEWEASNTDKPSIAAGSVIEIDGSICKYATETALTDEVGLADGWCYIKHVVSGTTVTPYLTNTFGTWDTAKHGYYDGSGNRHSLFAMYRSGAVTKIFTDKHIYNRIDFDSGSISLDSSVFPGGKLKYKIFNTSMGVGVSSVSVAHNIVNAYTNKRIIDIRMTNNISGGSARYGGENDSSFRVQLSSYNDTNIGIDRTATATALTDIYVFVTYI